MTSTIRTLIMSVLLLAGSKYAMAVNDPDYLGYPVDSEVKIYINWESFEAHGIPSAWKGPFLDVVINTYTRWMHVAGFRLTPRFWNYTTRTDPRAGEILIMMNEKHGGRLASRFGKPAKIVFHRKNGNTNTDWDWVPYPASAGQYDMMSVLMHEMGHAFGLEHNTDPWKSVMDSYKWRDRYGPFFDDIADVRAQYGTRTSRRFKIERSTDSAASWAGHSTNLTSIGVSTSMDPTASRDSDRMVLFYTSPSKKPSWIIGNRDATSFDTSQWRVFGGLRSAYGNAGHGYDNEYMMAWVDDTDDNNIKVVYSSNGAQSFSWRNAPGARSFSTPAVHKVATNTWVLAYSKWDPADRDATGRIIARVSTNDGLTWSDEIELYSAYRAASGVSIASDGTDRIRIGFSWSRRTTNSNFLKRTLTASLSGETLTATGVMYESESTRTHPVLVKNRERFIEAWREQNRDTSINTRTSYLDNLTWGNDVRAVTSSPITPALAAFKDYKYAFLFHMNY